MIRPWVALLCATAGALSCEQRPAPTRAEKAPASAAAAKAGVEIQAAPARGALADIIGKEQTRARADGRKLLVYVGATWCEPCQYLKQAIKRGELDAEFAGLRLLEFDRDRDETRLREAGCLSRMIPLLARVNGTRCSSRARMEGSIKGPGAVAEMTPRLKALLASP